MFGYRSLGFGAFPNRGAASPTIESIRESRVYTWTAGLSTTSQTVINREANPADGSSQTTYDVRQGTSTGSDSRDPTYGSTLKNYRQSSTSSLDFLTMEGFKMDFEFFKNDHSPQSIFFYQKLRKYCILDIFKLSEIDFSI